MLLLSLENFNSFEAYICAWHPLVYAMLQLIGRTNYLFADVSFHVIGEIMFCI